MEEELYARQRQMAKKFHSADDLGIDPALDDGGGAGIIYGVDDRRDYFEVDMRMKKLADSTVLLTYKSRLTKRADGKFALAVTPFRVESRPPCSDERFGNQHTGGWCSGFMVGEDVIVTAGHCCESDPDVRNTAFVFGFRVDASGNPGNTIFDADQVYFGKELIAHDLSPTGDFAVVRVDRLIKAPGAAALPVRLTGEPSVNQAVGVVGYPTGLPVKIAFGDQTKIGNIDDPWIFTNLDTYGGNSGSPVFDNKGVVEGILVRGGEDYHAEGNCFRSSKVGGTGNFGEVLTKAAVWSQHLPSN